MMLFCVQYSDDPERFSVKETHSDQLPSNELQASVIKVSCYANNTITAPVWFLHTYYFVQYKLLSDVGCCRLLLLLFSLKFLGSQMLWKLLKATNHLQMGQVL